MSTQFVVLAELLPGRTLAFPPGAVTPRRNVHLGIQRGREVVQLVPGDAGSAEFTFEADAGKGGFVGPWVHGRAGERFIYLSWGEVTDGTFAMFARIKLHLKDIDATTARRVTAKLAVTDAKGGPVCGTVRPPRVEWTIRTD